MLYFVEVRKVCTIFAVLVNESSTFNTNLIPNTMNNSETIQDLKDALILSMREVKDLRFEIANLRDRLGSTDRQWNKTIDELERLKHMPEVHKAIYGIK